MSSQIALEEIVCEKLYIYIYIRMYVYTAKIVKELMFIYCVYNQIIEKI